MRNPFRRRRPAPPFQRPHGWRFREFKALFRARLGERFGLCEVKRGVRGEIADIVFGKTTKDDRRLMRNARKRERHA